MEICQKTPEKIVFKADIGIELANALRRSVNEIPILAIDEVDIYKNDSALYDETLAHRLGFIPLKNQKLKSGQKIQFKLKAEGSTDKKEVLSGELGERVVYPEMPLVLLEKDQEIELVARAGVGTGKEHAKYVPGLFYYRNLKKIEIGSEAEKKSELVEKNPNVFEFNGKLKVKNEWACDFDDSDLKIKGIKITETDNLVFFIESWGQTEAKEIFVDAVEVLESNLKELEKILK